MKDNVVVPDSVLNDPKAGGERLAIVYDYTATLPPKKVKQKK